MTHAKAYANHAYDKPFVPYEFERRQPGPTDVAINIAYCGICHSDLHTARSEWGQAFYPCVPGHEIVGVVSAIGRDVKNFAVGQKVGVGCMVDSCRTCGSCKEGLEQYCEKGFAGTYNSRQENGEYTKGGYSSHIVVDQSFVLHIPDGLDLAKAAPLLCAGITTYSPLRYVGVGKGCKVAVLGLGGLGHMGVKIAAAFGAEVSVLSGSEHKVEDARRLGAHKFLLTSHNVEMKKHANYFDFILDTVSAPHDLNQAFGLLKREGSLLLVGASDRNLEFSPFPLILGRRKVLGSLIGGISETQEMLDFCAKHNITSEIELIKPYQINEAYERMLKSDVKFRFVIDCSAF